MANLAAGDVTYTLVKSSKLHDSSHRAIFTLTFGDGVKTYPAGGIPITTGNLGCPNTVYTFDIVDCANASVGYQFIYDKTNAKLQMLQVGAHTHSLSLKNAAVADGATTRVNAGTNLLGANTGSDITVAGGGANGGVANTTIGALAEASGVAIPAQSITVEVTGW